MDQGWINGWGGGLEEEVVHPVDLLHSCDFSVSPSPFGLDLGTLDLGLTTGVTSIENRGCNKILPISVHSSVCSSSWCSPGWLCS